jgi:hypothetical protein
MLVENAGLKNAVPLGTKCDDFSNGLYQSYFEIPEAEHGSATT